MVSVKVLVMLCLLYIDVTLLVLEFKQEDTLGGIHIVKPMLGANCNDDLNFSRVSSFLYSNLYLLLGQAHDRYGCSEILVCGFWNLGNQTLLIHTQGF